MTLGKRLRQLRGKRTQQEIADRLGISRSRYSHYETGFVQPDNDLLYKMAEVYDVTTDFILGRSPGVKSDLSPDEVRVLEQLRKLNDMDREMIVSMIERLSSK